MAQLYKSLANYGVGVNTYFFMRFIRCTKAQTVISIQVQKGGLMQLSFV